MTFNTPFTRQHASKAAAPSTSSTSARKMSSLTTAWLLLLVLAASATHQHTAQALSLAQRITRSFDEAFAAGDALTEAIETLQISDDPATIPPDESDPPIAPASWLERSILREVDQLRRAVRHLDQRARRRHSKRSHEAEHQLSDQQLAEVLRTLKLPLLTLLQSRMTATKRGGAANKSTRSAGSGGGGASEKRPTYLSPCHFKICHIGGKRSVRSINQLQPTATSRLIVRPELQD